MRFVSRIVFMFKKALLTIVYLVAVTGLVLFIMKMLKASENRSVPLEFTPTPTPTPYVYLAYESMKEVPAVFIVSPTPAPSPTAAPTTVEPTDFAEIENINEDKEDGILSLLEDGVISDAEVQTETFEPTPTEKPDSTKAPEQPKLTTKPLSTKEPAKADDEIVIIVSSEDNDVFSRGAEVTQNDCDRIILADSHSTGAHGALKKAGLGNKLDGIRFSMNENGTANVMNFSESGGLGSLSGTAVIENFDFSNYDFIVLYENIAQISASIVFRNCKFGYFQKGQSTIGTSVPIQFENCTIGTFCGVNASFKECMFSESSLWNYYGDDSIKLIDCAFKDNSHLIGLVEKDEVLRVGSVWMESGETHLVVSNFTGEDRKLRVYTDFGESDFSLSGSFDVDEWCTKEIIIPNECSFVLAYDITHPEDVTQIRFYNAGWKRVYLSKELEKFIFP